MHLADAVMKMLYSLPPAAVLFVVSCMEVPAYVHQETAHIHKCMYRAFNKNSTFSPICARWGVLLPGRPSIEGHHHQRPLQ